MRRKQKIQPDHQASHDNGYHEDKNSAFFPPLKQTIQRKGINKSDTKPTGFTENYVENLAGGQPLPQEARKFYEPRFGFDFTNVRVHTDTAAARSAKSINALAYTVGNDIVFNDGQYSLHTDAGKKLLTHELTHVVQQQSLASTDIPAIQRSVSINSPYALERDMEPSAQFKKQDRALGRCDPLLNGVSQATPPLRLNAKRFENALQLPGLSERNLDDIDRPDLSDPVLDPVRNNLIELKKKSNGKRVKLVQEALIAWGRGLDEPVELLPQFGADSVFGKETEAAVHFFQDNHAFLVSDGIVGDLTLAELQAEMDKLHGIIFTLQTVGHNVYEGKVHIPPPFKQWISANATDDEFFNNKSVGDLHKAEVATKCGSSKRFNLSFTEKNNVNSFLLTHERVHEKAQLETINKHLVPWDTRLEIALLLKLKFKAKNKKEAMQMVFDKSGAERPEKLARTIIAEMQDANAKFHQSAAGQGPNTELDISKDCKTLTFIYSPAF